MNKYQFDFTKTTVTELEKCRTGTFDDMLLLYDKVVKGGVCHLSLNEITYVVGPQFKAALEHWMQYGCVGDMMPKPQVNDSTDDASLRDMLDGIEGLE